ncbi:hypothetical protein KR222_000669, partial [Zaprionus bogoriensis]
SLSFADAQLKPLALVEMIKKEQKSKTLFHPGLYMSPPMDKMALLKMQTRRSNNHSHNNTKSSNNLPMGYSHVRTMPLHAMDRQHVRTIREYSVCLNPIELQLQAEKPKMSHGNSLPMTYGDMASEQASSSSSSSVALVPLEQQTGAQSEQSLKNVGNAKPQPQSKAPEQPVRKIPYYNPLRRRSNVDPARVQYIKDRFKERNLETDMNKPPAKKYVSRTTLHSGRLDKID